MIKSLTRAYKNVQKAARSLASAAIAFGVDTSLVQAEVTGTFLMVNAPKDAILREAYILVTEDVVAGGTTLNIAVGTTDGGSDVLPATDANGATAGTILVSALDLLIYTDTGVGLYLDVAPTGDITSGALKLVVNYDEPEKRIGEYTQF